MKNIINTRKALVAFVSMFLVFSSCQDTLEDEFYNPEKQTEPSFEMLFTGALQPTELFRLEYGPGYHQSRAFNRVLGLGTFPYAYYNTVPDNSVTAWTGWSGATLRNTQFNKTYVDFNKNIPVLNLMLNGLSEEEKPDYEIYVHCINVVKAYMFQRLTDIYDDVPYTEANGAYEKKFWAKYDTQESIYMSLLDELKTIDAALAATDLNTSLAHEKFRVHDILNNGDVLKWRKFANSMRLRMAIRISGVAPEKSQEVIADIVGNDLPLVTEAADFIGMAEKDYAHVMEWYWPRAMKEMWYNFHAPRFMVKDIFGYDGPDTPEDQIDPRLYTVFQPNQWGDYVGVDVWGDDQFPEIESDMQALGYDEDRINNAKDWAYDDHLEPYFSFYNKVTYYNFDMKYPAFTPTETHLLLAEAAIRFPGSAGSIDPVEEYKKAIAESIDWYYQTNKSNTFDVTSSPAIPANIMDGSYAAQPAPDAFLEGKGDSFSQMSDDDKIKEIFYQKFAHLNILNYWEIWSETRRLQKDYGILAPVSDKWVWMERFYYPSSEETTNPDNFAAVAGKNNHDTPVWWTGRTK
ncbi:SusD/RagB family nutrient-binding outer membrane lipoprotein [Draconibacterium sp. IB214405]|uniref:SusD/RagB family nutrient-binding outer membrane lipoprotein n=1 Tax=Draconibacterium sp. IB214405 TaxID=3097352 RepID=UPI002A1666E5|nr:SusD/RagB family nutrient-binding outer membrane lipoprotein [Draconibacterium sp. IB214405]MDX8340296.1 SusD/RagB family nutrient-binding outer membrane lipoprotein [Draconibacterium sp. IB214405]